MALYSVLGPDGNTYNIEGPEGAKERDVLAAAENIYNNRQLQELEGRIQKLRSEPSRPEETSGFGAARAAGWQNLQADLAALAGKTGVMDEKKAEEIIAAKQKEAARVFTPTQDGWLESPWTKFKELAGGSLPYMAAPVAAGVGALALPASLPAAAIGTGLAGLASATQFAGSNLSRQLGEQEGEKSLAKTELAPALAAAPFQAALDIVSLRMVPGLGRVFQAAGKELTEDQLKAIAQRGLINNVARSGAKTASAEGLTEVGQQVLERAQASLSITDEKARDEYLDSLIGGAVLGGAVGAPAGIGARGRAQRKLDAAEAARLAAEEGKPGTSLVPIGERGVTAPETRVEETPVEFMGRENVPAADQTKIGMAPTTVPTAREALDIDEETGTAVVKANVPGAQRGQQGVLDIFGGEPVTGDELATRMQADRPSLETAAPRLTTEPRVEEEVETVPAGQGALPLVGGRTTEQQIIEMYAAEQNAQAVANAKAKQAERDALSEQNAAAARRIAEQERLKFESDLAATDARLQQTRERTTEDNRLGLLLPLIADTGITNIPKAFGRALQAAGFTGTQFTPRERELIQRAYDVRVAEPVAPEQVAATPNEMDVYKPPRATQTAYIITPDLLTELGIPPRAPVYKNIVDRNLFESGVRDEVVKALRKYASNTFVPQATKDNIKSVLQSAPFLPAQPKPKGAQNVGTATAPKSTAKPSASKPSVDVGVPSIEAKAPAKGKKGAEGVSEPKQPGLDDTGGRAKPDDAGEGKKPVAVKKKDAYSEGVQSAKSGESALGVPYAEGTTEHEEFNRGYLDTKYPSSKAKKKTEPKAEKKSAPVVKKEAEDKAEAEAKAKAEAEAKQKAEAEEAARLEAEEEAREEALQAQAEAEVDAGPIGQAIAKIENGDIETKAQVRALATKLEKNGTLDDIEDVREGLSDREQSADDVLDTLNSQLDEARDNAISERLDELREEAEAEAEAKAEVEAKAKAEAAPKAKAPVNPFDAMVNEVQKGIDVPPTWANKTIYKLEESLNESVPESVQSMLRAGDLKGALQALASASDGVTKRIVTALVKAVGGTKVNIVTDLRDEAGNRVSGTFDPETNTISLDADTGLTNHAVLHEMTHAAISHILDNPSHPITKQLTRLYNSVKPLLDTAYGAQNLQEFVAEAWGNPEFRAKLSAMTPDGTPVTAWQKFVNIVKNALRSLVGMESRGVKSVADEIDTLIEAAISPAPETRYGGSLLALSATGQANKAFDAMSDVYNKLPYLNDNIKNNLSKFFEGTVAEKVKSFVRSALPLNALTEVAKKYIPMAPKLMQLINLRAGTESMFNAMLEPTINRARAWAAKQDADTMRTFNDVVYMSTTNGVDPSKPRKDYLDAKGNSKVDKSGNKLVDTWDKLQPMWNSLEKSGGQTMYKEMRDTYKKLQDRIGVILEKRINEEFAGDTEKAKTANSLLQKLYKERGMIEPYFPLTRNGSYWLTYNLNGERVEEAFESPRARRMAREEIEATAKTAEERKALSLEEYKRMTNINYRNAPSSSFVGRVLNVLEANDIKGDAQNEIVRMYLDALPENSFAQAFRTRKNTPGFERDAIRAFSTKPYSIARQLANLEYGAKLNNLDTEMREHVEKGSGQAVDMYNELAKHIKFAISPDIPEWSKIATSIGFNMTLGFNLSSALVNLTQIPLVTLPYLGGKYGLPESSKAIAEATRIYLGSKFKDKSRVDILGVKTDMKAMPSLDNYDFDSKDLPADVLKYKILAQVAAEYGQLNRSQIYDILDVDKTDNLMTKVNAVSGFVFHHGERMNREITLMSAFNLEMQRMKNPTKLTPEERAMTPAQRERRAAENAIELTELTNGTMSAAAAPSLAQSGIGKVLFMFKRYGVSMYYMLFKTTRDALVGQDQDVKDAARKQIAGIYGAAALLAGARGVPMFGIAAMVYNLFKDDDDDDLETATRKWMGETAYSGALNGITNLDFASRIGLSDLIFRDQKAPESQTVLLTAMEMMGGPVYGVGKKIERGITLINDGNIGRGIEQMLPSAFGNGLKSIRYATEGATTLRGDAITSDINAWNVGAQALGFAPADYNRQQEINAFAKGFERTVTKEQKKLLLNYYMAARVGDNAEMQELSERMADFNKRHPSIAITADTLQKSMRGHAQAAAEKYHGVTFNKRLRPEIMQSVQEFE